MHGGPVPPHDCLRKIFVPSPDGLQEVGVAWVVVVSQLTVIQTEACFPQL